MTASVPPPPAVPFGAALRFWFQLGFVSFGGPAGQIALLHRVLVEERRWIGEQRFQQALQYCMLLPGPEAQQLATYLGWLMHRTAGGVAAGVLFVLPGAVLIVLLAWGYLVWGQQPWVAGLFAGIRPAVAALVVLAVWRMGSRVLRTPRRAPALWTLALASFAAIQFGAVPFPAVVLGAAAAGAVLHRLRPGWMGGGPVGHAAQRLAGVAPQALFGDGMPPPAHARFRWKRSLAVVAVGVALAAVPLLLLAVLGAGLLQGMGVFFTQAALLTFGGAYAVLPYVAQAAVAQYGWVTAAQMMDGLALGESTPGPLILVLTFIAFLGGWQQLGAGAAGPLAGGLAAAAVATWFTFLPSFVFILAGAPLVESGRQRTTWAGPLAGLSAAVVGAMAALALLFIAHSLGETLATGLFGIKIDLAALAIALLAGLLLARRLPVVPVLLGAALLGLARQVVR